MLHADRWLVLFVTLAGLTSAAPSLAIGQDARPAEPKANPPGAAQPPPVDDPRDVAVRGFLLAMMAQDEAELRAVALPADGLEWLLRGEKPTGLAAVAARVAVNSQKFKHLQPGDEVALPGGRKLSITPDEVDATHAVLMPSDGPLPFRLQQLDGAWKVDARPLIAARKAAQAARAKAEIRKKAQAEPPKA